VGVWGLGRQQARQNIEPNKGEVWGQMNASVRGAGARSSGVAAKIAVE